MEKKKKKKGVWRFNTDELNRFVAVFFLGGFFPLFLLPKFCVRQTDKTDRLGAKEEEASASMVAASRYYYGRGCGQESCWRSNWLATAAAQPGELLAARRWW